MQTRMGERLRFEFDVAPGLEAAALPPLLLQPLVENAVKHGLEPLVDGGTVRVRIERLAGDRPASLRISVEDDGAGLDAAGQRARPRVPGRTDGAGIALANLHERLRALYGDAAVLRLGPGTSGAGALACLIVPQPRA
jgi:sensor histidine kinase YesM